MGNTVTTKGQVTIPKQVRDLLGIKPGSSVAFEVAEDGRVLLRYSGTESLARVMVEGPDEALIRVRANELAETMVAEIGS